MDQYSTAVDHEAAPEALTPGAYAPESISLSPFVGGVRPLSAPDRAEPVTARTRIAARRRCWPVHSLRG